MIDTKKMRVTWSATVCEPNVRQLCDEIDSLNKQLEDRRHTNAGWNAYYAQEKEVERLRKIEEAAKNHIEADKQYSIAVSYMTFQKLEEALK